MSINAQAFKGMKDILPLEADIRQKTIATIMATYESYGFMKIETPAIERIEFLTGGEGGENEKLIFKILKRGEKLTIDAADESGLTDSGLRYDLTVPLSRFYANNHPQLPHPFKSIQIGPVWRAERPQKGRFRQFTQCDIDIIGEAGEIAEIELIAATAEALQRIGFTGFTVRINDRRILTELVRHANFDPADHNAIFITIDKLDKVGLAGVKKLLDESPLPADAVTRLMAILQEVTEKGVTLERLKRELLPNLDESVYRSLENTIGTVQGLSGGAYRIVFDLTLVRGMSYYTGQIFEIALPGYGSSVAGGGRYDNLVGKFTGRDVPACGFSIGFERIVSMLLEQGAAGAGGTRLAVLYDRSSNLLAEVCAYAKGMRDSFTTVSIITMTKNTKKQIDDLKQAGFTSFCIFRKEGCEVKAIT